MLALSISFIDVSAFSFSPGFNPTATELAGVRFRNFSSGGGGEEVYLGKPDLGVGSNRTAINLVWQASNHIKFVYTPSGPDNLKVFINNNSPTPSLTYTTGSLGSLNYLHFFMICRSPGSMVSFNDVTVTDGSSNVSPLPNFVMNSPNSSDWQVNGLDFTSGLIVEGDLVLTGTQPNNENSRLEIKFGSAQTLPVNNIVGFWPFDECGTSPICNNEADGYSNYPGLMGGPQINRIEGKQNGALDLTPGTGSSYVDIGHVSHYNFDFGTPFTVASWFRFTNWGDMGSIVSKMLPNLRGWSLSAGTYNHAVPQSCLYSNGWNVGGIRLELNDSYYGQSLIKDLKRGDSFTQGWGDDSWHFVVATYSAASYNLTTHVGNANDIRIYVDGQEITGCASTGSSENTMATDARLRIGNRADIAPQARGFRGKIDEVYLFNKALNPGEAWALWSEKSTYVNADPYTCQSTQATDLVLWLDPNLSTKPDGYFPTGSGVTIKTVPDMAFLDADTKEDAVMDIPARQPVYVSGADGINGEPAVKFSANYQANQYGQSDIMQSKYNEEITAKNSSVVDEWHPSNTNKTLMLVFQAGADMTNPTAPYYSDGRQTICEFGGPLSGFNVYLSASGNIGFGMWNRFERVFINNYDTDFYPIAPSDIIVAHLEFDGTSTDLSNDNGAHTLPAGNFRAMVTKYVSEGTTIAPTVASEWHSFHGLSEDMPGSGDWSGIGGAMRTSYYDYNTGETYSDHFNGLLGQVFLYNAIYTSDPLIENDDMDKLYNVLNSQYKLNIAPPVNFNHAKAAAWRVQEETLPMNAPLLSEAYPNPFVAKTSFGVNMPSAQPVTVALYDAQGNKIQNIFTGSLSAGIHDFSIDGANLNSGMYIFRVTGQDFVQSGKVILSK